MSVNLNNEQSSSTRISKFVINKIVKSKDDDQESPDRLVIFSNSFIEGSDKSIDGTTAIHFLGESTIYAPPSAIRACSSVSFDECNLIEVAVSQHVIDYLKELKANSQYDPKKFDTAKRHQFTMMLSACS
jgi:hypothetical protein